MAAQIPIKNDPKANETALKKVREDKEREVEAGHDGTWVAHPGLVPVAREIFDKKMKSPHQIQNQRGDIEVTATDLLALPDDEITMDGLRTNISVGIQYLEAWLRGNGCVPLYHLMEDAATAEISRSQVWQWIRHGARTTDGSVITRDLVTRTIAEEMEKLPVNTGRFPLAARLFEQLMTSEDFPEFLTLVAYEHID